MSSTQHPSGVPVKLSSQGRYYESGGSEVVLAPIRGEHEAMLADANPQSFHSISTQVLKDLTSELPVKDFKQLLIGDKYELLIKLRQISYPEDVANSYGFRLTCPSCKAPNDVELDLRKSIHYKNPPVDAKEPIAVPLPDCGKTAFIRLLRVMDEEEMAAYIRKERSRGKLRGDPAFYFAIAKGLLGLDDTEFDFDEAVEFVKGAGGSDTLALRDALEEFDPGPELEMDFTCTSCYHSWFQSMPLSGDFFRPGLAHRRANRTRKI